MRVKKWSQGQSVEHHTNDFNAILPALVVQKRCACEAAMACW